MATPLAYSHSSPKGLQPQPPSLPPSPFHETFFFFLAKAELEWAQLLCGRSGVHLAASLLPEQLGRLVVSRKQTEFIVCLGLYTGLKCYTSVASKSLLVPAYS